MIIEKLENKIVIKGLEDFDIDHILLCGQVFRFKKTDYGYLVFSKDKIAKGYKGDGICEIQTSDVEYFFNYFDLSTNYSKIKQAVA